MAVTTPETKQALPSIGATVTYTRRCGSKDQGTVLEHIQGGRGMFIKASGCLGDWKGRPSEFAIK